MEFRPATRNTLRSGHRDEFGVTAVAMFADHFRARAELLVAGPAECAIPAGDEVMDADAIAGFEIGNLSASLFNHARDFVTEREGQPRDRRNAAAVMRIRMADAGGANANQYIVAAPTDGTSISCSSSGEPIAVRRIAFIVLRELAILWVFGSSRPPKTFRTQRRQGAKKNKLQTLHFFAPLRAISGR